MNDVDPSMETYFTNTHLFCLCKSDNNPTQILSISVPEVIRQIMINKHAVRTYWCQFARYFLPFNHVIGVNKDKGMNFIVWAVQLAAKKYIIEPVLIFWIPEVVLAV